MRSNTELAIFVALASISAFHGASRARADRPVIVLVTNHADARIVPLLSAELQASGIAVHRTDRGPNEITPSDLRDAARAHAAVAAFRVLVTAGRVEVWVADRVTGKIVLREVLTTEASSRVDEVEVVLRAVELLRASLLELDVPQRARGEIAPPPELASFRGYPADEARVGVRVAGALTYAPGGLDVGGALRIDIDWRFFEGLRASLLAIVPLAPSSVRQSEGSAALRPLVFGAHLGYRPHQPRELLQPSIGIGIAAVWQEVVGSAISPYVGSTRDRWTAAPYLSASFGLALTRHFHVVAAALAGLTLQPIVVVFDGREVASFGPFFVTGSLGIEVALP